MSRLITLSEIQPGDIWAMRLDKVGEMPLTWRLVLDAIGIGERLVVEPRPVFGHIAIVASVGDAVHCMEELADGADATVRPVCTWWDGFRPQFGGDAQRDAFVDYLETLLHDRYDYRGIPLLGLARLFRDPAIAPAERNAFDCSSYGAVGLRHVGLDPWPGVESQLITPADYEHGKLLTKYMEAGMLLSAT